MLLSTLPESVIAAPGPDQTSVKWSAPALPGLPVIVTGCFAAVDVPAAPDTNVSAAASRTSTAPFFLPSAGSQQLQDALPQLPQWLRARISVCLTSITSC